jgi:hypothetical protein
MISVILYGRNDSYGYNLAKRAAISINCLSEILAEPGDEVIFVDCNTSNDLPTFVEAIYDTLTHKAKSRLRVLRVRPELHRKIVGPTHLTVVEPHPRNIAIRRSNPENRWILNTNTDVVLLPRPGFGSLNDTARDLADGLYTVPRFELPEALWETFPRTDPAAILEACRELGPGLHLDEVNYSVPENRYDQVGDFQLTPRQALWDIHGFDERMVHGWHCDSNICKRLHLYYGGRTESLAHRLKAYHCDHTRVATANHGFDFKIDNNVQEFVFEVTDPRAAHQAGTWGAANQEVEAVDFARSPAGRYFGAVGRAVGGPQQVEYVSDSVGMRDYVSIHPEHVLAYLASDITVYRRPTRFAYIGNHARMLELIARTVPELGFEHPVAYAKAFLKDGAAPKGAVVVEAEDPVAALLANYDFLIFDLSIPREALNGRNVERVTDWPREQRYRLGAVARCLEVAAERAGTNGNRAPEFMVINANHHLFWNLAGQFLLLTATPYATHVRKGRPRLREERKYRGYLWKQTQDSLRAYFGYGLEDHSIPRVETGQVVDFSSAGEPGRFKDGDWGAMDAAGSWTDGSCAAVVFRPPPPEEGGMVLKVLVNEVFIGPEEEPIRVAVLLDGARLNGWQFFSRYELVNARAIVQPSMLAGKDVCRLEFHVENPVSTARAARAAGRQVIGDDPGMLGFRVQRIEFASTGELKYEPGTTLRFTADGEGGRHTDECWSRPDDLGVWTFGPRASLTLRASRPMGTRAQATFTINDVALNEANPSQTVRALWNGRPIATWTFGPTRTPGECPVLLPPDAMQDTDPVSLSFEVATPRSPVELGWSTWDTRMLGFRLAELRIVPAGRLQYHLGEPIDFVEGGDSLVFAEGVGTEWALPGVRGSWTVGPRAGIRVPLEEPVTGDLPVAFAISDCLISAGAPELRVKVKANGAAVGEWALASRKLHCRSVTVPAAVASTSRELAIEFEIAEPRSPQSLGWSADPRPLGFLLARVAIGRSAVEPPKFKLTGRERPMHERILGLPQYAVHVARILARRHLGGRDR